MSDDWKTTAAMIVILLIAVGLTVYIYRWYNEDSEDEAEAVVDAASVAAPSASAASSAPAPAPASAPASASASAKSQAISIASAGSSVGPLSSVRPSDSLYRKGQEWVRRRLYGGDKSSLGRELHYRRELEKQQKSPTYKSFDRSFLEDDKLLEEYRPGGLLGVLPFFHMRNTLRKQAFSNDSLYYRVKDEKKIREDESRILLKKGWEKEYRENGIHPHGPLPSEERLLDNVRAIRETQIEIFFNDLKRNHNLKETLDFVDNKDRAKLAPPKMFQARERSERPREEIISDQNMKTEIANSKIDRRIKHLNSKLKKLQEELPRSLRAVDFKIRAEEARDDVRDLYNEYVYLQYCYDKRSSLFAKYENAKTYLEQEKLFNDLFRTYSYTDILDKDTIEYDTMMPLLQEASFFKENRGLSRDFKEHALEHQTRISYKYDEDVNDERSFFDNCIYFSTYFFGAVFPGGFYTKLNKNYSAKKDNFKRSSMYAEGKFIPADLTALKDTPTLIALRKTKTESRALAKHGAPSDSASEKDETASVSASGGSTSASGVSTEAGQQEKAIRQLEKGVRDGDEALTQKAIEVVDAAEGAPPTTAGVVQVFSMASPSDDGLSDVAKTPEGPVPAVALSLEEAEEEQEPPTGSPLLGGEGVAEPLPSPVEPLPEEGVSLPEEGGELSPEEGGGAPGAEGAPLALEEVELREGSDSPSSPGGDASLVAGEPPKEESFEELREGLDRERAGEGDPAI